jgi:hypothetical protein
MSTDGRYLNHTILLEKSDFGACNLGSLLMEDSVTVLNWSHKIDILDLMKLSVISKSVFLITASTMPKRFA